MSSELLTPLSPEYIRTHLEFECQNLPSEPHVPIRRQPNVMKGKSLVKTFALATLLQLAKFKPKLPFIGQTLSETLNLRTNSKLSKK